MNNFFITNNLIVSKQHCDRNNHMNIAYYLSFYSDSTFLLLKEIGLNNDFIKSNSISAVVSRIYTAHKKELYVDDLFLIESSIIEYDHSCIVLIHKIKCNSVLMSKCYMKLDFINSKSREKVKKKKNLLSMCNRFFNKGVTNIFNNIY